MLVDPLSNFYLYYSLEKNDGTAVSERVQVSEACWHSSGQMCIRDSDTPNQAHDMGYSSRTDQIADQGIGSSRQCLHRNEHHDIDTTYDIGNRQLALPQPFYRDEKDKPDVYQRQPQQKLRQQACQPPVQKTRTFKKKTKTFLKKTAAF